MNEVRTALYTLFHKTEIIKFKGSKICSIGIWEGGVLASFTSLGHIILELAIN
jgi:hypothetical protein